MKSHLAMTLARALARKLASAEVLAVISLACMPACGGGPLEAAPAALTVALTTKLPFTTPIVIAGTLQFEGVSVLGDVSPDERSEHTETTVTLLGGVPIARFDSLQPGLYSRLRFAVDALVLDGSFDGLPLHIAIAHDRSESHIDLRAPMPVEILPGSGGQFDLLLDLGAWFGDGDLDHATRENGAIQIDATHNLALFDALPSRVAASFTLQ